MAQKTEMSYIKEQELGTVNGVRFEYGHYVSNGKAYESKIYGFQKFTKSEKCVCKISLAHFEALASLEIDLSELEEDEADFD